MTGKHERNGVLSHAMLIGAALFAAACTGVIGDGDADGPNAGSNAAPASNASATAPGHDAPLARLTRAQYANTLRDLFAPIAIPEVALPADVKIGGFDDNRAAQTPAATSIEAFHAAALVVAQAVLAKPNDFLGCTPTSPAEEDACAASFVARFGPRAYRRPLADDERTDLVALYHTLRGGTDFAGAMSLLVQAMLQSPHFLYRVEIGEPVPGRADVVRLGGYEIANRLSYLLWNTMPDDALFAAAANGALATPEGVANQARRMMADARAHDAVRHFFEQWLEFDKMDGMQKDATMFPSFGAEMRTSLRQSAEKFVDDTFFGSGSFTSLLTDDHAWVDDRIAPLYGVAPPGSTTLTRVTVDATQRAGILTNAGLMAGFAHEQADSPVLRGVFVLDRVMCTPPPPAPPNVPPPPTANAADPKTTRDRFALQHEQGGCAGCHRSIDGIGFGFEHYDALGQWRTKDSGFPVDSSGWFPPAAGDLGGTFDGAVQLAQRLAASQTVHDCFASQWARYAFGVDANSLDKKALAPIVATFAASGLDMRELLVALVQSDAFRMRPTQDKESR